MQIYTATLKDKVYIQGDVSGIFTTLLFINSKKLETVGKWLCNIRQGTLGGCLEE